MSGNVGNEKSFERIFAIIKFNIKNLYMTDGITGSAADAIKTVKYSLSLL
jgi:hypothetical protein